MERRKYKYRPSSLFGMLICGGILVLIGICMTVTHQTASNNGIPVGKGRGGGRTTVNGSFTIILGAGICAYTFYLLSIPDKTDEGRED